jgi:uncharacterized phage protein gp47/JayE
MPFERPLLTQLIERGQDDLDARLPGADSRLRQSVLGTLVKVHSGAVHGLYGALDYLARQILPDTADAEHLERWAGIWDIARKPATLASGQITVTGANGSLVPAGARLQRAGGVEYAVQADVVIAGGAAVATVAALASGVAGAAPVGTRLTFVSPLVGVVSATTVTAGGLTGGADEEADVLLRERLLERIREAPAGGAPNDYVRWAKDVPEVTRAWVYPQWMGAGTVGVTFVMDGRPDPLPQPADIAAMLAYLQAMAPVTADLVVFAPIATPLDLTIGGLMPNDTPTRAAIEAEIDDLLFREAEPGALLLVSHIREAISQAAGEEDHTLINPVANIVHGPAELAVRGVITWAG